MSTNRLPTQSSRREAKARRADAAVRPPVIHLSASPIACPLTPDWPARLRHIRFSFSSPAQEALLQVAHHTGLGARLAIIEAEWQVAGDDHSQETPAEDAHLFPGFPCHIHAEFEVGGQRVHIDRTWANLWGPGRLKVEWHIFVDGVLAGFGGELGCSLGFYRVISPAVALLRDNQAIVIRRTLSRSGIALPDVMREPDQTALHAVSGQPTMRQPGQGGSVSR